MQINIENGNRAERARRIADSIHECDAILAKAQSYMPKFQDAALIEETKRHRANLEAMLAADPVSGTWP